MNLPFMKTSGEPVRPGAVGEPQAKGENCHGRCSCSGGEPYGKTGNLFRRTRSDRRGILWSVSGLVPFDYVSDTQSVEFYTWG